MDDEIRELIWQQLRGLQLAGIRRAIISTKPTPACLDTAPASCREQEPAGPVRLPLTPCEDGGLGTTIDERRDALAVLQQQVAQCTRCSELAETRTQTVFGCGNIRPRLCLLGEAPGADEDRQGLPFVGRSGKLLTDILQACTLRREDVYILNVLKCRPPNNRTPAVDEVRNCRGYFERQLEILQPEFICCLGTVAAQALLETSQALSRLRGRFHDWRGSRVLVTYHPSYLLRNPAAKRDTWEDMQLLMREMGIPLPGQG